MLNELPVTACRSFAQIYSDTQAGKITFINKNIWGARKGIT
jgi:hypothetical protein